MNYFDCILDSLIECDGAVVKCAINHTLACELYHTCAYMSRYCLTRSTESPVHESSYSPDKISLFLIVLPVAIALAMTIVGISIGFAIRRMRMRALQSNAHATRSREFHVPHMPGPPPYEPPLQGYSNPAIDASETIPSAPPSYEEACMKHDSVATPPNVQSTHLLCFPSAPDETVPR